MQDTIINTDTPIEQLKAKLAEVSAKLNDFILDNFEVCWSTDYAAVELRVITAVTEDPVMIDAYRNGKDLHYLTASTMFNKLIPETEEQKEEAEATWPASKYIAKMGRLAG